MATAAAAQETIRSFESRMFIAKDGELDVTETIRVRAEGDKIKRGIYRDFPLLAEGASGRMHEVGFRVVAVRMNGESVPWATERSRGVARIRIGDPDVFLRPGTYTYEITYRTDRQIRFFEDHDELFWNVTGNFWIFPIERASIIVTLPERALIRDTVFYTGPLGARERNARIVPTGSAFSAAFETTRPLGQGEGLTVGIKFNKGIVDAPDSSQQMEWFLRDNLGAIVVVIGLLAVLGYYSWAWLRVGRDPPRGVVVPRWDAPDGISPALSNYIDQKGFSGRGFDAMASAIVSLAVKQQVTLDDLSGDVTIKPTKKEAPGPLPVGEAALMRKFGDRSDGFTIDKANGTAVKSLHSAFISAIEKEHRGAFYKRNLAYVAIGIALSVVCLILFLLFGRPSEEQIAVIVPLAFLSVIGTFGAVHIARNFGQGFGAKLRAVVFAAFGAFMLFSATGTFLSAFLSQASALVIASVVGLLVINVLFFFLLGAPTPIGAKMMNGLDGLKTYIQLAERDRMNLAGAPEMSPKHFETVLPYAIALGLERPWSQAFQNWLLTAAAAGAGAVAAAYSPSWYRGRHFDPMRFERTMSDISTNISHGLASSMPAPKSSSSGFSSSGGFSGGGGGGGGGGGW